MEKMSFIPSEWLTEKMTIEAAEAANTTNGRVFGFQHLKWERLKAKMLPGDEIWEFCSPPSTWAHLQGRQGYAVVRNGTVVDSLIISQSEY
jgi:hypothetical protein